LAKLSRRRIRETGGAKASGEEEEEGSEMEEAGGEVE
jgi:hypothetical protein